MIDEIWKTVWAHPRYEVSNYGRIRSLVSSRILKPWANQKGYLQVKLDRKNESISSLVLEAFVGLRPQGLVAAHNNGDNQDNRLKNLRWATYQENSDDQLIHGTRIRGESHSSAKLTGELVIQIREEYSATKISHRKLASRYNVDHRTIGRIVKKEIWTHL